MFSEISLPSTIIDPSWCSSSLLIHLIKVDLPDPEGPQTTIFSLGLTSRLFLLKLEIYQTIYLHFLIQLYLTFYLSVLNFFSKF